MTTSAVTVTFFITETPDAEEHINDWLSVADDLIEWEEPIKWSVVTSETINEQM